MTLLQQLRDFVDNAPEWRLVRGDSLYLTGHQARTAVELRLHARLLLRAVEAAHQLRVWLEEEEWQLGGKTKEVMGQFDEVMAPLLREVPPDE